MNAAQGNGHWAGSGPRAALGNVPVVFLTVLRPRALPAGMLRQRRLPAEDTVAIGGFPCPERPAMERGRLPIGAPFRRQPICHGFAGAWAGGSVARRP